MAQIIVRLTLSSNAVGPFDIFTGSTETVPIGENFTRDELIYGVNINLDGSTQGTPYTLFIVSKESDCGNVISKNILVYDQDEIIRKDSNRGPDVTPSPTPLNQEYDLFLFNSVCQLNGESETVFLNIPSNLSGNYVSYDDNVG